MTNVTNHIIKFQKFMIHCWKDLDDIMDKHDWDNDGTFTNEWLQANWEFLVERQLLKKNGGELRSFGSYLSELRISRPNASPTHEIICLPKNHTSLYDDKTKEPLPADKRLIFYIFLKKMDGSYGLYPPFNYAGVFTIQGKKRVRHIIAVDSINFFLVKINSCPVIPAR